MLLYLIFLSLFIVFDFIWLSLDMYSQHLTDFNIGVNGTAAVLVYLLLGLAPFLFIFPYYDRRTSLLTFFVRGALLGFTIYGVYELTNMAVLQGWSWSVVWIDITWGTLLYGVVTTLTAGLGKKFKLFN